MNGERDGSTVVVHWLDARIAKAPVALRARIRELAASSPAPPPIGPVLARVASRVLREVAGSRGDRSVALDLLAADALITLALVAQAESDPATLAGFARELLGPDGANP